MAKGNAKSETVPAAGGLPLFFKSPAAINSERHAKAAVQPSLNVHFAVNTNSVMVNAVEFVEAAKHYPIVFSMDEGVMPTVVLGLEQNNNFIDKNDHWVDGAYIPAYVRRYPFVFTSVPDSDNLVLCIDEAAPQ